MRPGATAKRFREKEKTRYVYSFSMMFPHSKPTQFLIYNQLDHLACNIKIDTASNAEFTAYLWLVATEVRSIAHHDLLMCLEICPRLLIYWLNLQKKRKGKHQPTGSVCKRAVVVTHTLGSTSQGSHFGGSIAQGNKKQTDFPPNQISAKLKGLGSTTTQ
jgi:hypothetical protein